MTPTEISTLIMEQISLWLPSLSAIIAIVVAIIPTITKIKSALNEVRETKDIRELTTTIKLLQKENAEIIKENKILIDKIAHIEGYTDIKMKKE